MHICPQCLAPIQQTDFSPLSIGDRKALRGRSTETEAQELRIIAALRAGPKTTDDLRKLGVYQVSARIWNLRNLGYEIETELFNGYSADGYSHARMARYTLRRGPQQTSDGEAPCTNT